MNTPQMQPAPAGAPGAAPAKSPWSARGFVLIGLGITALLFFGVGVWSASAKISGAVIAQAELRVENKRQTVQHLEGGVVSEIMARDGDVVLAGDVLMRLDRTTVASNLEIVEGQLDELMSRQARLDAERLGSNAMAPSEELLDRTLLRPQAAKMLDGQRALFDARLETMTRQMSQLDGRVEQIRDEIRGADAQIEALGTQLELIQQEVDDARDLFRQKLIPRSRLLSLEREAARLAGELGALVSTKAQSEGRIAEIELRILELEASRREEAIAELRDMTARISELRERRTALAEQLSRMEIRAPQSGVVLDMSVNTVGGVVSPAEPLLYIVPTDEKLVVEAQIETFTRDQVKIDQPVTVLFTGFNQRTTPEMKGLVSRIGADALIDERTGFPYYAVEIAIPEDELARLRAAIDTELAPGMPAEAHIQTGERTAASYFLRPILDSMKRAFRED